MKKVCRFNYNIPNWNNADGACGLYIPIVAEEVGNRITILVDRCPLPILASVHSLRAVLDECRSLLSTMEPELIPL